ncbi:MAG: GGDEF domain-containing protein, partial [Clostridiales bacterium]|nr:GGDEF domain-containing protein [Clostridiales bacterium]
MDGYYNVLIRDDDVMEDIIYHLINHHKYTKINMLTGPKENPVSIQRLNTYKRILTENNIPIEEDRICYGDFWKFAAKDAVDKWMSDPKMQSEAIVCANDYMAMTVCNALAEKGFLVPRDIAVAGCDNIEVTKDFIPPITTVGMPVFDMGMEAVDIIHGHNQNKAKEKTTYLKSITYIRESCGCKLKDNSENLLGRRNNLIKEVEDKDRSISNNAYMSIDLTGVTSHEDLNNKLASYTYLNEGFSAFYMCLYKDWDKFLPDTDSFTIHGSDEITMEMGIKKGEWLQKAQFHKRDLLPPIYMDDEPSFFYFNMLHHQEKCYGYTAISFTRFEAYKPSYQGWLINVCNALENIKTHNELNRLVYKLEDMSIKDEMTGLYNRRALHTLGQAYLDQSVENNSNIMVFSADMDNLKYINDNFG